MKKEKIDSEKKRGSGPEKFWSALVKVYFQFYQMHFRDESGFGLSPTWNEQTRGMESKGLKEIIKRLRGISEEKKIEWTEEVAKLDLINFLKKAHANNFYRKNFMCCFLNKYKDLIIVSVIDTPLVKKMLDLWYTMFPDKKDPDRDVKGVEIIIGYFKQQYIQNKILFTDDSALSSFKTILLHIKTDEFWSKKSLVSIGYNISEFVIKIKSKQNGTSKNERRQDVTDIINSRNYQ